MDRRRFLASGTLGAALLGASPAALAQASRAKPLPPASLFASDPEKFWARVRREQFFLPEKRVFLNNGSLGVLPRPVMRSVVDYLEMAASLEMTEYPRWGYESLDAERAKMSAFLGCSAGELAFTQNCTEAMSFIANGLDLKAGDEVLTTDHEHPGGRSCWEVQAARHGVTLREVAIPHPPKSSAELAELLVSAIGPRTKVLSFSGILTKTGVILPVAEICRVARSKGVATVIDGAHMNGQVPVSLRDLECDYFAGSPHKWLFAPAGCGILYGRGDALDRLWPTVVTSGWNDKERLGAARFQMVGTNNRAIFVGMMAGAAFLEAIGESKVYDRIHHLAKRTYDIAVNKPYVEMLSAADESLYGCLICMDLKGDEAKLERLWKVAAERKIWLLGGRRLRLSHHIHTRPEDVDAFFSLADEVLG